MNKKESQRLIAKTLNAKFNEKQFTLFIHNLLNEYEIKNNNYHSNQQIFKDAFRPHIEFYKRIVKYTDPNGIELDVLIAPDIIGRDHLDWLGYCLRW